MAAGVSLLTEMPYRSSGACGGETHTDMEPVGARVPTAKYTKVGETLRHVIPGHMQCSMACGGRACKYENPSRWSDEEQAVKGLYSSWITDNLLAMARPSTDIIEKYSIIEQFQRCGLRTVINLQRPGEHASCGNPLEAESGFTYRPEILMEAGIYFYNFGWKDYGVASLTTILDMVKVMSFAIQEGKMAVHCHAGLGRTGVLLACYLVFKSRMSADQAILFVRAKRPNSIQTRGQLLCVREFAQFLVPLRSVFSCAEPKANAVTLSQYLTRQRHLLHGYEARRMKNVPKVVQLVCRLLLDVAADRRAAEEPETPEIPDLLAAEVEKTVSQQALQQLGKEMRVKGIPAPLPPLRRHHHRPGPPPAEHPATPYDDLLPSDQALLSPQKPLQSGKRSLSYSDSALYKLGPRRDPAGSPALTAAKPPGDDDDDPLSGKHFLSQNNLAAAGPSSSSSSSSSSACPVHLPPSACPVHHPHYPPPQHLSSSPPQHDSGLAGYQNREEGKEGRKTGSPLSQRRRYLHGQRSVSFGFSEDGGRNASCNAGLSSSVRAEGCGRVTPLQGGGGGERKPSGADVSSVVRAGGGGGGRDDTERSSEVPLPLVTLQAELSLEARSLLVAKALTVDLDDEELSCKVSMWQTELNSREGAWERLGLERDPLVLSGLMWSWLEQLKEPVITSADAQALSEKHYSPAYALSSLEKGHRLTLLCILDCAARLLAVPEEEPGQQPGKEPGRVPGDVEADIVDRTIRAITKIPTASANDQALYKTLKAILTPVLREMREKATEEKDSTCHCSHTS